MQRNQNMVLVFSQVFQSISFNWIQEIIQLISTKNETTREKNISGKWKRDSFILVRCFLFLFEVVVTLLFFTYISEHRFVIWSVHARAETTTLYEMPSLLSNMLKKKSRSKENCAFGCDRVCTACGQRVQVPSNMASRLDAILLTGNVCRWLAKTPLGCKVYM